MKRCRTVGWWPDCGVWVAGWPPGGMERWKTQPAYIFRIEEIYDNSATKDGFGQRLAYPEPDGGEQA